MTVYMFILKINMERAINEVVLSCMTTLCFSTHGTTVIQEGFSPVIFLACQGGAGKVFGKSVLFDDELSSLETQSNSVHPPPTPAHPRPASALIMTSSAVPGNAYEEEAPHMLARLMLHTIFPQSDRSQSAYSVKELFFLMFLVTVIRI